MGDHQFIACLRGLTARTVAYRFMVENRRFDLSRLDEKWAKAGGVVQRSEAHIEGRLDELIAKEDTIKQKTEEVFTKQNAPLDDQLKALDALDRKLDLLSNGGPQGPLPGSGSSPVIPPPIPLNGGSEASTEPATH